MLCKGCEAQKAFSRPISSDEQEGRSVEFGQGHQKLTSKRIKFDNSFSHKKRLAYKEGQKKMKYSFTDFPAFFSNLSFTLQNVS